MKKKIYIGVTDFSVPSPRTGSIDTYSGFGGGQEKGQEIHKFYQERKSKENPHYRSEVTTRKTFEILNYQVEVSGRIDGVYSQPAKIEEIKSSFNIYELAKKIRENEADHPYIIQLKTYGYFHYLETHSVPQLSLLLISSRNGETLELSVTLNIERYEDWLQRRLTELSQEAQHAEKRSARRKKAARNLAFPFAAPRTGQKELIECVEATMKQDRPLFLQAPTGLGKTVGVLFPTLREALARGQRLVYVTPKNSQHSVAEEAMLKLQENGTKVKSMTLTAKSKMCFKNEAICNPDYCEFAKDYYAKVADLKLIDELSKKKNLTSRVFKKIAETAQVCPFELQIDSAKLADTIICDYNYVFAPRSALSRSRDLELDQEGKPNLVIDEAHNLPARSLGYYSPELSTLTVEKMRESIKALPDKFKNKTLRLLDDCILVIQKSGPDHCHHPCEISPPVEPFLEQDSLLREHLSNYLKSDVEIKARDPVMALSFYWAEFTQNLEFISQGRKEFFTIFKPDPAAIKITCCDASEMLKLSYENFSQVVGFSATLKPFDYYSRLSGLENRDIKTKEFGSPFPKENRKLMLIPQISSKYSDREKNYPKIADTIAKIASIKRGNYFAFFPSFDFMEKVYKALGPLPGFELLKQERYMHRDKIEEMIEKLAIKDSAHILFGVQGGVFSEGVDYPGEMSIGAFVVGPPLPNFDLEREKMRCYYQEHFEAGFEYAYSYPAMAKSVQAAGRVIRSENDRGVIILMDSRFGHGGFAKSMPEDWFNESPQELVSSQIIADITRFWDL